MNISNILKVADAIEQAEVGRFDMANWVRVDDCGTAACIAGHCYIMSGGTLKKSDRRAYTSFASEEMVVPMAREFLGLTKSEAAVLFLPNENAQVEVSLSDVTPEQAVRCLRNLAITGKVDWEAAMKPAEPVLPPLPVSKSVVRA